MLKKGDSTYDLHDTSGEKTHHSLIHYGVVDILKAATQKAYFSQPERALGSK